jgi:formyltetrahydrofolate deformylase
LLKVTCPGTRGIVAAIGNYLADRNCYITEMVQFDGEAQGRYFSRVVLHTASCCRQDTQRLGSNGGLRRIGCSWPPTRLIAPIRQTVHNRS